MFLQVENAVLRYTRSQADHPAVDRVSFTLTAGQIGVLIGPSGCGKTSLLRAVAGLEGLAGGRILMEGRALSEPASQTHLAPESRRIGMVFQDYALFPHFNLRDNIAFGLNKLSKADRAQRVQEMLDLVGLGHAGARFPHQISGGQQQRIALARALAPAPRLLLLDEPFSSLDIDLRERLAQDVRQILKTASGS
jgi:iron(III) transport system ATP-binding protein